MRKVTYGLVDVLFIKMLKPEKQLKTIVCFTLNGILRGCLIQIKLFCLNKQPLGAELIEYFSNSCYRALFENIDYHSIPGQNYCCS